MTLSLLVCLNARTLLSDMIGSDQAFFHSHLKRQPLTVVVGNLIPSTAAGQLGRVGGFGNGSRVVVGSVGGSRPGTGKSGQAGVGEGGEIEGGGNVKTFDDLAKARDRIGRGRGARGKGFEVEITRVVTEVHDEMGSGAAEVGIESREEEERKTFEEEVEEDANEVKVTSR